MMPEPTTRLAPEDLEPNGFDTVIVTSADVTGRPVGKRFPPSVFRELLEEGVALSSCVLGWDVDQWPGPVQAYTGHHTGWHDVRLVPDLATLRPAGWLERTAVCVADFVEMDGDGFVAVAPRTVLRRQIEHLENAGFTPQIASELEFALYRGSYDEAREHGYERLRPTTMARADYTVQAGDQHEAFFGDLRRALDASDLGLWTSQVEWGLGQWEVNLRYQRALEMADRHLLFKLAVRGLAARHGMAATFMAKPFADTTGSSSHLHLSLLNASGANVFHDPAGERGSSATLRQAVGGMLDRAPDLMLFYAPTVNAYRRILGGEFSGNGRSWGWDSRMVSCRVLTESPASTRLEWRVPGADVNPYLAIAAVLASAADGIWTGADPGEPLVGEDWERPVPPLPASLGEAVERFRDSGFTAAALGKDVVDHYAVAGAWEWQAFQAPEAVTEWERRRYFEVI
jgi:glutamine synthetase